ncbi:MAG: hypothetical protein JOZ38_01525 [Candidatus Eremiobacteraeota bacterium]|nr:hypothetical protein [Candidatus Eremiobacteraeota bacterium]
MQRFLSRLPTIVASLYVAFGIVYTLFTLIPNPLSESLFRASFTRIVQPEDDSLARGYIESLRRRDYTFLEESIDPSLKSSNDDDVKKAVSKSKFDEVASELSTAKPLQIRMMGFHKFTQSSETDTNIVYELRYPSHWTVASVTVKWTSGEPHLYGMNVTRLDRSLESTNGLFAPGKGPAQMLALTAVVVVSLLSWVSLVMAAMLPNVRWRWLWMIATTIGVCQFEMNWTTGASSLQPIYIRFPPAGMACAYPPYAPWILIVSLPIGAFAFFLVHWLKNASQGPVQTAVAET